MYKDHMNIQVQRLKNHFSLSDIHTYWSFQSFSAVEPALLKSAKRRKEAAEATTSSPGARCSWREPEVAIWHCAVRPARALGKDGKDGKESSR